VGVLYTSLYISNKFLEKKDGFFNKQCWDNWFGHLGKKIKLHTYFTLNPRWIKDLNIKKIKP
jgi:hypothetical protein